MKIKIPVKAARFAYYVKRVSNDSEIDKKAKIAKWQKVWFVELFELLILHC